VQYERATARFNRLISACSAKASKKQMITKPGSAFDRSVLTRRSRGTPFRQLKGSVARLFRKSLCNLIPRIEPLLQRDVWFDSLLDLVKRETEFT
jgi:hypothetical protein